MGTIECTRMCINLVKFYNMKTRRLDMDTMKAILERRSIRKYTDAPIDKAQINEILKAGMYAPSGGNAQPWDFVVVTDKDILNKITEVHPYAGALKGAAAAIIVCGNKEKEKFQDLWIQDCSAATMNMLLAAQNLEIGTVWLGLYPEIERVEGVQSLLNLPEHITPFSAVALGHPAESRPVPERFDANNIHYNGW